MMEEIFIGFYIFSLSHFGIFTGHSITAGHRASYPSNCTTPPFHWEKVLLPDHGES